MTAKATGAVLGNAGRGLVESPVYYISMIFLSPILGQFAHYLAPEGPTVKGQPPGIVLQGLIFCFALILWAVYKPIYRSERTPGFLALSVSLLVVSVLLLLISIARGDLFNHTAWLFPLAVLMIWAKPPPRAACWRIADVTAFGVLAICIATQLVEWCGFGTSWSEFPLRWEIFPGFFEIQSRWEGPFGNVNNAGPVGVYLLVYGLSRARWIKWILVPSGIWIIAVAQTRASLVAAVVGVGALYVFLPQTSRYAPRRYLKIGIAVIASVAVASFFLLSATGLNGRAPIWRVFIDEWLRSPLWGFGEIHIAELQLTGILPPYASHGHSIFIDTLGRYGLFGLAAMLGFITVAFYLSAQGIKSSITVTMGLLLAFIVNGIAETQLDWRYWSVFLAPLVGVLYLAASPAAPIGLSRERGINEKHLSNL